MLVASNTSVTLRLLYTGHFPGELEGCW